MRKLYEKEKQLILLLGNKIGVSWDLDNLLVVDMDDGGMGSIKFIYEEKNDRKFGAALVDESFMDEDKIMILVTLITDQYNDLSELDIWKGDFSKTIVYPNKKTII